MEATQFYLPSFSSPLFWLIVASCLTLPYVFTLVPNVDNKNFFVRFSFIFSCREYMHTTLKYANSDLLYAAPMINRKLVTNFFKLCAFVQHYSYLFVFTAHLSVVYVCKFQRTNLIGGHLSSVPRESLQ